MNDPPEEEAKAVQPVEPPYIYLKDRVDPVGRFLLDLPSYLSLLDYPFSFLLNVFSASIRKKQEPK